MRFFFLSMCAVALYSAGHQDGEISECRRSFQSVDKAIETWDECEQAHGLATWQAWYRLTHWGSK